MAPKWTYFLPAALSAALLATMQAQHPVINGESPVVSPDGSHIVFLSNRGGEDDVFVMSANGSNETQLTHSPEAKGNVQWSSDGKLIIFSRFADGLSRLYALDINGKNEREIARVPGRGPAFSPDGRQIVYGAGQSWTATILTVSAADGSHPRQVTDGTSIAWNTHWSPDGKQLAFTGRKEKEDPLTIFVMDADGSRLRQAIHLAPAEGGAQWPVWSPDGQQIAFQANQLKEKIAHLWIADVATGAARKLAAHDQAYLDETPSWFPDGKRIAFQSNRTGVMEVWVINVDGSGRRQLTGLRLGRGSQ
jgi:Tol biopolymer transport system component